MKRIIIHWTAGAYEPSEYDKQFYHFLVDKDGGVHVGRYKPEDNENCNDGRYAAHCGGGNTGSIGVAVCAMAGFREKNNVGNFPITKKQIEGCFKLCASLAKKYGIPITANTVMTHYEFGKKNPQTDSRGKIDIVHLPPYPTESPDKVGDFIRAKIRWYYSRL